MTAAPKLDRSFIMFYFILKIDFKDPNKLMQQFSLFKKYTTHYEMWQPQWAKHGYGQVLSHQFYTFYTII